jgi:hypothetical protein
MEHMTTWGLVLLILIGCAWLSWAAYKRHQDTKEFVAYLDAVKKASLKDPNYASPQPPSVHRLFKEAPPLEEYKEEHT